MRALCLPGVLLFLSLSSLSAQTSAPVPIEPRDARVEEHRIGPIQVMHRTQQEIAAANSAPQPVLSRVTAGYCTFQVIVSPAGFVESAKLKAASPHISPCPHHEQEAETIMRARRYQPWLVNGRAARVEIEDYVSLLPPERWGPSVAFPENIDRATLLFTLERTPCFGNCPQYTVTIDGQGTVNYNGTSGVGIPGHHTAHIEPAKVDALLARFRAANFLSALPEYQTAVTDISTHTLTLSFNGQTRKVVDYGGVADGMPWVIHELEDAVDETAGTKRWIKPSTSELILLQREKWDFSADTADNLDLYRRAIGSNDKSLIGAFLKAHAPAFSTAGKGAPPVCVAARMGDVALVEEMLHGQTNLPPELKYRCLVNAAASGQLAMLDLWLSLGANPTLKAVATENNGRDSSEDWLEQEGLLASAALSGNAAVVRRVLEFHPDPNLTAQKEPLLHWIIGQSRGKHNGEVLEALLDAGANPDATNDRGDTALFECQYNPELIAPLLKAGANINARNQEGSTPLIRDAYIEPVVRELLAHGADPSLTNSRGQSALSEARRDHCEACEKLIQDALARQHQPSPTPR